MGNSLAQHLKRIGKPVRYALDPVHAQAISLWLRGQLARPIEEQTPTQTTPGRSLSQHYLLAQNRLPPARQSQAHDLYRGVQAGEPELFGPLHDLLRESGILHEVGQPEADDRLGGVNTQLMQRLGLSLEHPLLNNYHDPRAHILGDSAASRYLYQGIAMQYPHADALRVRQAIRDHLGRLATPGLAGHGSVTGAMEGRLGRLLDFHDRAMQESPIHPVLAHLQAAIGANVADREERANRQSGTQYGQS